MRKSKIERPNQVALWLSEDERDKLELLARKTHNSLSGTIRRLILKERVPMEDDDDPSPLDY
jgi:hypothetical protein